MLRYSARGKKYIFSSITRFMAKLPRAKEINKKKA